MVSADLTFHILKRRFRATPFIFVFKKSGLIPSRLGRNLFGVRETFVRTRVIRHGVHYRATEVYRCVRLPSCVRSARGILFPLTVYAQASLSGVVRDSSGAVLPGVTVEAASPALIEKVRTSVTDGNGRYQLIDLRPGAYSVTFTLAGFNAARVTG